MTKRMLIMIGGIVVLVAILAFGFFLHIKTLIASAPKPFAQTVTTTKVESQDWQPTLAAVGSVVAVRGVDVTTEIAGLVREIHFKSGQDVKKGQQLGLSGATGRVTGPHLHWAIRWQGGYLDPAKLLKLNLNNIR